MNTSIKAGIAIAILAFAMTGSAHAEALPGYECNQSNYGALEWTSEAVTQGTYYYFYGCTESGWMLFATAFCDNEGNCYSD